MDIGGVILARKAPKMTELIIEETSGVDHPAHLHEGWLVVKASNTQSMADVLNALPEPLGESMSEESTEATAADSEVILAAEDDDKAMDGMEPGNKQIEEELAMAQARIAELESRIAELEGATEDEMVVEDAADDVVALAKSAPEPIRKAMQELVKAKADAENALAKEREDRADADAAVAARDTFKHLSLDPEKVGPALRRLSLIDATLAKSVEDALIAADAQNESANIFTEVGKGYALNTGDAIQKMTSLAKAAVAEGKAATVEQAMASVAVENPALYNEYLSEKGA
jgi:hypothetical protein